MVELLMRHGVHLSGLLGIYLNLKRLVVFLDVLFLILMHSMLDLIILHFGVICVGLLIIVLLHVDSIHAILS